MTTDSDDDLTRLRAQNSRLTGLLDAHGIAWHVAASVTESASSIALSTDEKIALFRKLFRGRTDVYPVRWDSKTGKSGYAPACANEWRAGVCEKPRIKCADCGQRLLVPLTDQTIYDRLAGRHTVSVYPLLADDNCHFLAADFDGADWRSDAQAFAASCRELGVPVALEISRSAKPVEQMTLGWQDLAIARSDGGADVFRLTGFSGERQMVRSSRRALS